MCFFLSSWRYEYVCTALYNDTGKIVYFFSFLSLFNYEFSYFELVHHGLKQQPLAPHYRTTQDVYFLKIIQVSLQVMCFRCIDITTATITATKLIRKEPYHSYNQPALYPQNPIKLIQIVNHKLLVCSGLTSYINSLTTGSLELTNTNTHRVRDLF